MINTGDKLVRYYLDENNKLLYDDVTVIEIINDNNIIVSDGENTFRVMQDLINDEIQEDKSFYMTSEVFLKAYMLFEKLMQLEKVYAEDELRRAVS